MEVLEYLKLNEINKGLGKGNRMCYPIGQPVELTIPCYDGENQPVHPSVVYIPTGFNGYKYWMSFTPYTRGSSAVENPSIVASNDGITWVVPDGLTNPLVQTPSDGYNRDAELVYIAETSPAKLRIYWGVNSGKGYYKESTDGITWSDSVELNGAPFGSGQSSVIRNGNGKWIAYSQPIGAFYSPSGNLGSYISDDGQNWDLNEPIVTNLNGKVWHIGSLNDGCGYHFIAGAYPADKTMATMDLFYGYSDDGRHITFDNAPIVQTSDF